MRDGHSDWYKKGNPFNQIKELYEQTQDQQKKINELIEQNKKIKAALDIATSGLAEIKRSTLDEPMGNNAEIYLDEIKTVLYRTTEITKNDNIPS